mmetsp:Transcript_28172/g.38740  ORF Transcript_28172/g.38740 Transcript_28172/m.38740 type:complete len:1072 (-) Transcript_28172:939-4154(-)
MITNPTSSLNDAGSGEKLVGLLQQTAVAKSNPLSGGRGGGGGRGKSPQLFVSQIKNTNDTIISNSPVEISKSYSPLVEGNITPPRAVAETIIPSSDQKNSPTNFIQIKKTFQGDDVNKSAIKSTPDKNYSDVMKQTVAKSNPLIGGRGSTTSSSSLIAKLNAEESTSRAFQSNSASNVDGSRSHLHNNKIDISMDSSKVETFVEIKRRFEEAAATNAIVPPLIRASTVGAMNFPNNTVSTSSNNNSGANSPGGSINPTIITTPPRSTSKGKSMGIMQQSVAKSNPLVGGRSGSSAASSAGRGDRGGSTTAGGGEGNPSLRLENFEEIKQKFELAAAATAAAGSNAAAQMNMLMARPRRSLLQQLSNVSGGVSGGTEGGGVSSEINAPSTKDNASGDAISSPVPVVAAGWSDGVGIVPAAITTPSPANVGSLIGSNGRPLLTSRSFDGGGMAIDRAQAPVMLQAVARSNPLVSGGRGVGGGGRGGGRISLASVSQERAATAAASAVAIGRVPLNWQSTPTSTISNNSTSSPAIIVGEGFVEKKRNYEKSITANNQSNLSSILPHQQHGSQQQMQQLQQYEQNLQQQQMHQQQLQQFLSKSASADLSGMRTPISRNEKPSDSSKNTSGGNSNVGGNRSMDRQIQMMQVAVAKSNPLVGGRTGAVGGRGAKGPSTGGEVLARMPSPQAEPSSPVKNFQDIKKSYEATMHSPVPSVIRRANSGGMFSDTRSPKQSIPVISAPSQLIPLSTVASSAPLPVSSTSTISSGVVPATVPASLITPLPAQPQQPMSTATLVALSRSSEFTGGLVPDKQMEIMQQAVARSNPLSGGRGSGGGRGRGSPRVGTPVTPVSNLQTVIDQESTSRPSPQVLTPFPISYRPSIQPSNSSTSSLSSNSNSGRTSTDVATSISSEPITPPSLHSDSIGNIENKNVINLNSIPQPPVLPILTSTSNAQSNSTESKIISTSNNHTTSTNNDNINPTNNSPYNFISLTPSTSAPVAIQEIGNLESEYSSARSDVYSGGGFSSVTKETISPSNVAGGGGHRQMEIMQQAVARSNPLVGGRGRRRSAGAVPDA